MSRFEITPTMLADVYKLSLQPMGDPRGCLTRLFCEQELRIVLGSRHIMQINHSQTRQHGSVRGLHFQQPPHAEVKIITCLRGAVFDVTVDIRVGSPTFLQWVGVELSAKNGAMILIPEGCAHGFQTLSDDTELLYLHTAPYAPESEGGLHYADPRLDISWPLPLADISQRDQNHALLSADFAGVIV